MASGDNFFTKMMTNNGDRVNGQFRNNQSSPFQKWGKGRRSPLEKVGERLPPTTSIEALLTPVPSVVLRSLRALRWVETRL